VTRDCVVDSIASRNRDHKSLIHFLPAKNLLRFPLAVVFHRELFLLRIDLHNTGHSISSLETKIERVQVKKIVR